MPPVAGEQAVDLARRRARPGIADLELDPIVEPAEGEPDLAGGRRELERIEQQVDRRLPHREPGRR